MTAPRLDQHGRHVKPHYAPVGGQSEGRAGTSTNESRQDGERSGIVKRFSRFESAGDVPIAMGANKALYAQAIEYSGSPQGIRGLLLIWGAVFASFALVIGYWDGREVFRGEAVGFLGPLEFFIPLVFCIVGVYMLAKVIRLELFRPEDEPTIFDRQHRKVYRVFREMQPGWRGLLKRWPMRAAQYDWDLIDVEHQATLTTTGSTVTRYHALVFLVKRSATDPTIIDSFTIGHTLEMGEQTVPAVWEHIRRFMEEGGPHLPAGESMASASPPQGYWQSVAAVGPFGSSYRLWWQDNVGFMILIHTLFPLSVPFFLVWGLFNWLSYRTATRIEWPEEVRQAVGPEMAQHDLPLAIRPPPREARPAFEDAFVEQAPLALPAKRHEYAAAREPLSFMRMAHPGGVLELSFESPKNRPVEYLVVDASQSVHRGRLGRSGRFTLHDVPAGELSVAYFIAVDGS